MFYLLETHSNAILPKCCEIIRFLARNVENRARISSPANGLVVCLVKLLDSPDASTATKACAALMNLCKSFESASDVMDTGVYKHLLEIIQNAGLDPNNWKGTYSNYHSRLQYSYFCKETVSDLMPCSLS